MKYPVFTYDDGTEVTASSISEDDSFRLYIEKWDEERNDFIHLLLQMPEGTVIENNGYTTDEAVRMCHDYNIIWADIFDYIKEKENESA